MDAIQEILAKRLTGSPLAESEEQVLANWLREPANADEFAELSRVWNAAGKISYKMDVDIPQPSQPPRHTSQFCLGGFNCRFSRTFGWPFHACSRQKRQSFQI